MHRRFPTNPQDGSGAADAPRVNKPRTVVAIVAASLLAGTGWSFAMENLQPADPTVEVVAAGPESVCEPEADAPPEAGAAPCEADP
jgi:hypothetical protein